MAPSLDTLRIPAFRRKKLPKKKLTQKLTRTKKMKKATKVSPTLKRPVKKSGMKMKSAPKRKLVKKMPRLTQTPRKTIPSLKPVGMVTHYYDHIGVAVLKLSGSLAIGDQLKLKGKKGEFMQTVQSMQVKHQPITTASRGADLGLKVDQEVRTDEIAYKL